MTRVKPIALPTFNEVGGFWIGMKRTTRQIVAEQDERLLRHGNKRIVDFRNRYIKKFHALYGDKYEYLDTDFHTHDGLINVLCPEHGLFRLTIQQHLHGKECPNCKPWKKNQEKKEKIRPYSVVLRELAYRRIHTPIDSEKKNWLYILKKMQPYNSFRSEGEILIARYLDENGIRYYHEWKLPNEYMPNPRSYMLIDFYLPDYNTFIEFNGIQHYKPIGWFGGDNVFRMQQERDYGLRLYCKEHGIRLIEISYENVGKIVEILKTKVKNLNK